MSIVPQNNVCYRIQNLDFGTFLGLVDDYPVSRTLRKASLVARAKKDGIKSQEWIFRDLGYGTWTIANHGLPFYIDTLSTPTATFYNPRSGVPSSARVTTEQENERHIVKIKFGTNVLRSTNGFDLEIGEDTDEDKVKWRLIEVSSILGEVGSRYRLRALNGRILNLDPNGKFSAMVLADAAQSSANKQLWEVEPASEGRCTVKIHGGGTNDYLIAKSTYVNGQDNWVVDKGPVFEWDLESIGGFAYQIIRPTENAKRRFALTVENDQDIILKPSKAGHGQIWLVERDYN